MSFSSEVKEELAKQFGRSRHCQIAELAGILELEGMLDEEGKLVVSNSNFSPPLSSSFAVIGFFSPSGRRLASKDQYSSGINASISSSRSHTIRKATDCTRPALSPLFTFAHNNGLIR